MSLYHYTHYIWRKTAVFALYLPLYLLYIRLDPKKEMARINEPFPNSSIELQRLAQISRAINSYICNTVSDIAATVFSRDGIASRFVNVAGF